MLNAPTRDFRPAYSRFIENQKARGGLHFAAHSHHFWPDCTREAQLRYWDDSARAVDSKWGELFEGALAEARGNVAGLLGLRSPSTIALAPNTHEFVLRLLSCIERRSDGAPIRVVTTDSEFHSFSRQARRLEEAGEAVVTRVAVFPVETFAGRFLEACREGRPELVFLSHVFFNSGWVVPALGAFAREIASATSSDALIAVDGYHAFCALPIDLNPCQERVFYIGGGYKYAQAGEGACFLHVPAGSTLRPRNTGWWADFAGLEGAPGPRVDYATDATRFAGSTFDPSGWYRFNSVMRWWKAAGVTPAEVHAHVLALQERFLRGLEEIASRGGSPLLRPEDLLLRPEQGVGHFLCFRSADAASSCRTLASRGVTVDSRREIVRIGFGLYHSTEEVDALLERLA
jgi:selenocysteine lyase/cysteine desulfurase